MSDLFDLLDPDPEPPRPEPEPPAVVQREYAVPVIREDRRTPTVADHRCDHPGCTRWGSMGLYGTDIATSQWWCSEHVPQSWKNSEAALHRRRAGA